MDAGLHELQGSAGGGARNVDPDGFARRSERRVRKRQTQALCYHLRGAGGAEELAAAARGGAGRAAEAPGPSPESVEPPGTSTTARSCWLASAIIVAGSPLSQVATPITAFVFGSDRIRRRITMLASLR